ncbi:hypothetical protein SBOR_7596 [Sclerotinia borealis F-4128]|uniref:Glycine zipper 2TM domain-containing protein n=1 Tax=Sclerotinia borealis (strain F-4128) TaxID=1432307 RepID=W9CBT7_SCLBF|nr:hypothetical protein SBOR_7596 [Sclerotinia borealis F-4128]
MDYAPIALQATDVFLDKHFHKIPDKAFRKETYRPRIPFKASRKKRREEKERRNSQDQRPSQNERRDSQDRGEDRDKGLQRREEEPYNDPEIEEAGYDSEPDHSSRQRERGRNIRGRDWDWKSRGGDRDLRDIPRHSGADASHAYGHAYEESNRSNTSPQLPYSQQPPHVRSEYLPKYDGHPQLDTASHNPLYSPPLPIAPSPALGSGSGRDIDERGKFYDSDEKYEGERMRRPKPIQRRSSYDDIHSQRVSHSSKLDQRLSTRDHNQHQTQNRRRSNCSNSNSEKESQMKSMKDKDRAERYGLKDEVKGLFTDSPKGLAGGAIGALVGGWATEKFQKGRGRERRDMGDRAKVITLLGAVAGGLVGNAVVDRWEDGRR